MVANPRTSGQVCGALVAGYGRKADKDGSLDPGFREYGGARDALEGIGQLEDAVGPESTSVDDAFGDAFVVEVLDFFEQDMVLEQRAAAFSGADRILIIGHDRAGLRG